MYCVSYNQLHVSLFECENIIICLFLKFKCTKKIFHNNFTIWHTYFSPYCRSWWHDWIRKSLSLKEMTYSLHTCWNKLLHSLSCLSPSNHQRVLPYCLLWWVMMLHTICLYHSVYTFCRLVNNSWVNCNWFVLFYGLIVLFRMRHSAVFLNLKIKAVPGLI